MGSAARRIRFGELGTGDRRRVVVMVLRLREPHRRVRRSLENSLRLAALARRASILRLMVVNRSGERRLKWISH